MISMSYVIDHDDPFILRIALWMTGNLLADRPEFVQVAIDSALVSCVLEILLDTNDQW